MTETLFTMRLPHNGTDTSIAGAKAAKNGADKQRRLVLEMIKDYGPCIRKELVTDDLPINVITARVNELLHLGLVTELDEIRDRGRVIKATRKDEQ